jgi:hypothetical protein
MRGEKLLDLRQAAEWMAAELGLTRPPRWLWHSGYYGHHGVKLEMVSVRGRWHTSQGAIRRFLSACTKAHSAEAGADVNELKV